MTERRLPDTDLAVHVAIHPHISGEFIDAQQVGLIASDGEVAAALGGADNLCPSSCQQLLDTRDESIPYLCLLGIGSRRQQMRNDAPTGVRICALAFSIPIPCLSKAQTRRHIAMGQPLQRASIFIMMTILY